MGPGEVVPIEWVVGVGGLLTSTIGVLWHAHSKRIEKTENKLEACEARHEKNTETLVSLSREVGELKGRCDGTEQLAERVISAVKESR